MCKLVIEQNYIGKVEFEFDTFEEATKVVDALLSKGTVETKFTIEDEGRKKQ